MAGETTSSAARRPFSVLVLVHTAKGEILLLKRRRPLAFWQSVTGSLEAGETHASAAERELAEETGLTDPLRLSYSGNERVFEIDPRWRDRYAPGVTHNTEYEWRFALDDTRAVCIDREEHSDYRWVPLDDAIGMVWSWTNRDALEALRAGV